MTKLEQARSLLATLTREEKRELLARIALDLGDTVPGIDAESGVMGGDPCILRSRIPVWSLVRARQLGAAEDDLLRAYPSLRHTDLANAWTYYDSHRAEIEGQIRAHEAA